jgi:hypothetical protein
MTDKALLLRLIPVGSFYGKSMHNFLSALDSAPGPFSPRGTPLGSRRRERLIENIRLESASLRPTTWTYPSSAPSSRGNNLTSAALAEATRRLDEHGTVRTPGLSYSSLLLNAGEALNPLSAGACDFFFRKANPATALSGTIWNVCSLHALRFSFTGARGAWSKALHDWMTSATPSRLPVQPDGGQIGLCRAGSAFWLSDQSPFELLRHRGLCPGSEDAAWAVLQELALPGFETRQRRKEAMGMVAIEFPATLLVDKGLSAHAWKPTAVDAMNYKGYCFLPGRSADAHGLTWPLRKCLRKHDSRDGLREFVHPHIRVPALDGDVRKVHLLGFFDGAARADWNNLSPP